MGNEDKEGKAFIPENTIKLQIGGRRYDAAHLNNDDGWTYLKNIEPGFAKYRRCYFEIPRSAFGKEFTLVFSGFLEGDMEDPVMVN